MSGKSHDSDIPFYFVKVENFRGISRDSRVMAIFDQNLRKCLERVTRQCLCVVPGHLGLLGLMQFIRIRVTRVNAIYPQS
jgi:hypothetical protein